MSLSTVYCLESHKNVSHMILTMDNLGGGGEGEEVVIDFHKIPLSAKLSIVEVDVLREKL